MDERTLDPKAEEETEATGQAETSESEEAEESSEEETDESLDEVLARLPEKHRKEIETIKKKATDFDGLVAKKRKLEEKPRETPKVNFTEDSIRAVLYKDNEKKVLRETVKPDSSMYIPELVDEKHFNQIVGYLPRSIDRSSPEAIHKALKIAVKMWKEDRGEKKPEKKQEAEHIAGKGGGSGGEKEEVKSKGRTFLKKQQGLDSWYKTE